MTLAEKLGQDYVSAYKAKDAVRLTVLRLLKTAMSNRLVELKQTGGSLPDSEITALLLRQAKQRKDSIEQYRAAGRNDLADREAQELTILEEYLPGQLSPEEVDCAVSSALAETGASGPADMGRVMKALLARYQGRVDAGQLSALVRKRLSGQK